MRNNNCFVKGVLIARVGTNPVGICCYSRGDHGCGAPDSEHCEHKRAAMPAHHMELAPSVAWTENASLAIVISALVGES